MHIRLIRHGMTASNAERRYVGSTDEPLCEEGRAEAERHAKDLSLERVYVSPLSRARETASILFPNAEQIVVGDLREMSFGVFEGRTADEMEHDPAYRAWVDGLCKDAPPGGDSQEGFHRRVADAFAATIGSAEGDPVFVIHGGVIMAILEMFAEPKRGFFEWLLPNLGGYAADCEKQDGVPVLTNVTRIP